MEAASLGAVTQKLLVQCISFLFTYRQSYFISEMSELKTHLPKLEADNYYTWSYRMEMKLRNGLLLMARNLVLQVQTITKL